LKDKSCLPGVFGVKRNEVEQYGETQGTGAKECSTFHHFPEIRTFLPPGLARF